MYIWNYYVNSYTRMWMSTKRCFRDLFSSLWWISWVSVQTGSPKSKGIASSKHSQRWMRFEVFFSGRTGHFVKKNTTQKGKFCFASPMEMASHFSIETNKQVTSTLLLCCVFFSIDGRNLPSRKKWTKVGLWGGHDVGVGHVWVMERVMKIHEISPENVPRVGYEIRQ